MRKLLFIAVLAAIATTAHAQANLYSTGVCVTAAAPAFNPGRTGCKIALDTSTQTLYQWKVGVTWVAIGDGIDHVLGGIAPAYTPTKWQSLFAANDSSELYQYVGTAWVCLNCVTGATYTAGTGISISGSNVISNTGDLSATNELQTLSFSDPNLSLSNGGGTVDLSPLVPASDALGTGFSSGGGSGHIPGATNITVDSLTTFLQGTYGQLHFDVPTHFDEASFFQSGAEFNGDTYFDLSPQFNGGLNAPFFQTTGANGGVGISGGVSVDGDEKLNLYVNDNVKMTLTTNGIEFPAGTNATLLGQFNIQAADNKLTFGDEANNAFGVGLSIEGNVLEFGDIFGARETVYSFISGDGFCYNCAGSSGIISGVSASNGYYYGSDYSAILAADDRRVPDVGTIKEHFNGIYSGSDTVPNNSRQFYAGSGYGYMVKNVSDDPGDYFSSADVLLTADADISDWENATLSELVSSANNAGVFINNIEETTQSFISYAGGSVSTKIDFTPLSITDNRTPAYGIRYNSDYSATFSDESLVSKRYVDARRLNATATLNFPSTLLTAVSDLTVTVTGAAVGDVVSVGVPNGSITATGTFWGWVSATNTVTVRFSPKATEDPASGSFKVSVFK